MHVSPFDHPLLFGLLGDEEAAALFSADAELRAMLGFEAALARAEAAAAQDQTYPGSRHGGSSG